MRYVTTFIKDNDLCESLNLGDCEIGRIGLKYLIEALENNQKLTKLSLSKNKFGIDGLKLLNEFLISDKCHLRDLNLSQNELGEQGCEILSQALEKNSKIAKLVLDENRINTRGIQKLTQSLNNNCNLTALEIMHNYLGPDACIPLAELLLENKLIVLDLSQNEIGDKGCEYLGEALKFNKSLKELALSKNHITPFGVQKLVPFLKENKETQMEHLDFTSNEMREGFKTILEVLQYNNSLVALRAKRCSLGLSSKRDDLIKMFKSNTTLSVLVYEEEWDYWMDKDVYKKIAKYLNRNAVFANIKKLKSQAFVGHPFGDYFADTTISIWTSPKSPEYENE